MWRHATIRGLVLFVLVFFSASDSKRGPGVVSADTITSARSTVLASGSDVGPASDAATAAAPSGNDLDALWPQLRCPVLEYQDRSVKDATFARAANGNCVLFFSAFYTDNADG